MPARNNWPTDCSVTMAYMINMALGGISMPSTDEPATTPTVKRELNPKRFISGTATRVKTDADAMEDPVIEAKIALAATVAMPRPPRMR